MTAPSIAPLDLVEDGIRVQRSWSTHIKEPNCHEQMRVDGGDRYDGIGLLRYKQGGTRINWSERGAISWSLRGMDVKFAKGRKPEDGFVISCRIQGRGFGEAVVGSKVICVTTR